MPTQEEWEQMINRKAAEELGRGFGQRSRFYGSDSGAQDHSQQFVPPPPPRTYVLKPIPTPGVPLDKQTAVLEVLRQAMVSTVVGGEYYFQGDRINLYELGFSQEPPILAGRKCEVVEIGLLQLDGFRRIQAVRVKHLPNWIDVAYFASTLPLIR